MHVLATTLPTGIAESTGIASQIAAMCYQAARDPEMQELQCWPRVTMDTRSGGPLQALPGKQWSVRQAQD